MRKLLLIRGLPGSGKSTMARQLAEELPAVHVEADMYFLDGQGKYVFRPEQLRSAHTWCQETTRAFLFSGASVVVSNTFTQRWELQPYLDMAEACSALLDIRVARGTFANIHNVPSDVIARMLDRWED
jgi:predicted kinase